ncbi:hypothetical protein L596_001262 [Steinernema carpocapsae]|uniref:F-box domain-containing protein n=1 Tax=Steinernema carpocapsae TaxID=34508 RepID=A0A4U8UL97_STECR|nr:hypothetical protein L596_001262 [Steinernema carpocapsae]
MESVPEKFIMAIISQFEQESMREASKLSSLWGDFVEDLLLNQKEYELALVPIKRSDDSEELYYYMCPRNNGLNPVLFENLNVAAHYVKIWHVCLYEEMPSSLNFTLASPSVIPLIKEVLVNNFLPINFTSCLPRLLVVHC